MKLIRVPDRRKVDGLAMFGAGLALASLSILVEAQGIPGLPIGPHLVQSIGSSPTTSPAPAPPAARKSPIALAITAQELEKPDLQYSLVPRMEDTNPGNAAIKYMEASEGITFKPDDEVIQDTLRYGPLQDMDAKVATDFLSHYQRGLRLLHDGARMNTANWETNTRRDGISAILPGLGSIRNVATDLTIAIRLDIKNHHWHQAQDKLQTGFAMARHLNQGETLIQTLVGVAIAANMDACIEDWISEPSAPNLYWPLSNLPTPIADFRRPMEFEKGQIFITLSEMREMRERGISRDTWVRFVGSVSRIQSNVGWDSSARPPQIITAQDELGAALYVAAEYPRSKRYLIDHGMNPADVEKISVPQVVGSYFVRSYDEAADNTFKWMGLPPKDALAGCGRAEHELSLQPYGAGNILARILLPSLGRAISLCVREDRRIAMLRTVEAIRAYAAEKGGLPDTLEQLTLPVPVDPFTDKPFGYERHGDGASVISASPTGEARDGYRYDLTLRK